MIKIEVKLSGCHKVLCKIKNEKILQISMDIYSSKND